MSEDFSKQRNPIASLLHTRATILMGVGNQYVNEFNNV